MGLYSLLRSSVVVLTYYCQWSLGSLLPTSGVWMTKGQKYLTALTEFTWGGQSAYGWCRWDLLHTACPCSLQEAHGEATSLWQMQDPSTTGRTWTASVPAAAPRRRGSSTSPGREVHNFTVGRCHIIDLMIQFSHNGQIEKKMLMQQNC